jgi:hypothetical protein
MAHVIKIDVEGAEADILSEDAANLLVETRAIFVEIHEEALRMLGSDSEELVNRLTSRGGLVVEIEERGPGNRNIAIIRDEPRADG